MEKEEFIAALQAQSQRLDQLEASNYALSAWVFHLAALNPLAFGFLAQIAEKAEAVLQNAEAPDIKATRGVRALQRLTSSLASLRCDMAEEDLARFAPKSP